MDRGTRTNRVRALPYLAFFLCLWIAAPIQEVVRGAKATTAADDLHAGIELSADGVRVIALQLSPRDEKPGIKLVYSEMVHLPLRRGANGQFTPQASATAAQAILKIMTRLRQQYRVPPERIYLIGSSRLAADPPDDLADAVGKATGLKLTFLDAVTEVQLSIVGVIPRLRKMDATWIDNRNSSLLFDLGSAGTQAGYEFLKYQTSSAPTFDYATMNLPGGMIRCANEASQALKESTDLPAFAEQIRKTGVAAFRQSLRRESEIKPGLLYRKRVFLTGSIVWAMTTLLYPEDRQSFVPISYDAIVQFADKALRNPQALTNPSLSSIRDQTLRQEVKQEVDAIKTAFTPQQLLAGAELLKAAAEELRWREKTVTFARLGQYGCVLSYVRLQAGT
jgi:hypothetical protein